MDIINIILNNPTIKHYLPFLTNYLQTFQWQQIFLTYKITAGVVSAALFLLILYFLGFSSFIKLSFWQDAVEILTFRQYGQKKIEKRWKDILKRLERPQESEQKLAAIEAESVLDEVLTKLGLTGISFGERIEQMKKDQLPSLDEVLKAHEMRNNIVHDPDFKLSYEQAKSIVETYEKALKELEVF